LTTGTSMTRPSSDVDARPRLSASSNAATTRRACSSSAADGEKHSLIVSI
jgi:hypothetical protein